jgi:hypothetical protein
MENEGSSQYSLKVTIACYTETVKRRSIYTYLPKVNLNIFSPMLAYTYISEVVPSCEVSGSNSFRIHLLLTLTASVV